MQPTSPLKKIALAIGFSVVAMSAQAQQDTLANAVKDSLEYQPEVQAKLHAFAASIHDRREAFGGYLPTVDLNGSMGQVNRDSDNRSWYSRNYAEASLTQMLFDGFRVRSQVAKAEHSSRQRYYELLDESETKALEVTGAYVDVLRYREMVRLAQTNLDNHRRVQSQIKQRADRGVSNNADLLQINGRVSLAESNLLTEIANLQTVGARFQRLVGRLPSENMVEIATGQLTAPNDIQVVLDRGYANNPNLHAAFEGIDVTEEALKEAKSLRYPTLEFGASHGTYKNNNGFDTRNDSSNYGDESIVELRIKYNLYRGGSDRAAERAAFQRINQAEDLRDKACVDLRQTASIAFNDIGNLNIKQSALKSHRDGSVQVVQAYREQFDIGRRSLLDVLDSENEAFQSERAYAHGRYDLTHANARTLQAMGELLNTLAVSGNKVPTLSEINADSRVEDAREYCSNYGTSGWDVNHHFNNRNHTSRQPQPQTQPKPQVIKSSNDTPLAAKELEVKQKPQVMKLSDDVLLATSELEVQQEPQDIELSDETPLVTQASEIKKSPELSFVHSVEVVKNKGQLRVIKAPIINVSAGLQQVAQAHTH